MRADDGAVHRREHPGEIAVRVRIREQRLEDLRPGAVALPAR
jgi:hypothetical protein